MTVTAVKLADLIGRGRGPTPDAVTAVTPERLRQPRTPEPAVPPQTASDEDRAAVPARNALASRSANAPRASQPQPVAPAVPAPTRAAAPEPMAPQAAARPAAPAATAAPAQDYAATEAPAGAPDALVKDIETLAVKLYSISRQKRSDPAQAMREALRSIEACLASIKKQH